MNDEISAQHDWHDGVPALLLECCRACGHVEYFRRGFCPRCGSKPMDTVSASGLGRVHAVTQVLRAATPEWKARAPYVIVLVDLDEGPRVMTHGSVDLAVGDAVRISYFPIGERLIPLVQPLDSPTKVTP
ncbi:OB-fold domain-containing protein [Paucibacter sp. R3-3]|uniref:OB-fold domain-containing protein n=1 Tax=Roseateles agri TaxID=3098619 RepID=A0ABU5DP20_9BURK|nr:OB-fold domain-containing protein [Paucibacter sp. R3-3]MDY0748061.1 OB-fold domain-containing protein [Paucibacter sp. R3-3]